MKSTVKRILLTLSAVMLFAVALCFNASAVAETGKCGMYNEDTDTLDNVTWHYNINTKSLVISGSGAMKEYDGWDNYSPFYNDDIKTIVIESGVTSIGSYAFYNCKSLESVTIPNGVINIGDSAFSGCDNLTGITIENSVESIDDYAFSGCRSLESVTIPDSVTSIGNSVFYDCTSLKSVTIGNSVTSIGDSAFLGCSNLESVTIPESLTSIGSYVFSSCTNLKNIRILNKDIDISNLSISTDAVIYCYKNSTAHTYAVENKQWFILIDGTDEENSYSGTFGNFSWKLDKKTKALNVNGIGFLPDFGSAGEPWKEYKDNICKIVFSDTITSISSVPFSSYYKLETVIIPNGIRKIEDSLFNGCKSLTTITIPDSVEVIGEEAFYGCESLKNVTIGKGIDDIWKYAFSCCSSLERIIIPDNVSIIREYVFGGCSSLTDVTIGTGVDFIGNNAFYYCDNIKNVHISDLKAWCKIDFTDNNSEENEGTNPLYYGADLYLNGELVKDLVIPVGVEHIGKYSFSGCNSIESLRTGNDVIGIDFCAFSNCKNLKSVTFGDCVTYIGYKAFFGCSSIESLVIPHNVMEIDTSALPDTLKEIFVYSKACEPSGLNYTHTIYGFKDSAAEAYANKIAAKFVDIETVHTTHEYVSGENRDYCNYEICFCGAVKGTIHTNKDENTICDNCKKSINQIDVGEETELLYVSKTMLKYTAVETGTYTFEVINHDYAETSIYDENRKELDSTHYSKISRDLKKGETVYWCVHYVDNPCKIVCSLSVEHKHSYEKNETKKATCTSVGEMTYTCSCGDSYKEEIPVSGHSEVTIQGKKATCTKKGLTDGKKCSVCNKVIEEQKEIKPLGHKEVTVKAVKATYTKTGLTAGKKCKICGKVIVKQKKVAKKKLKKVTISSVKSTKAKQANVSWKKVADATGYVVEYSTSKKFTKKTTKKVTVKKAKSIKTTLKKLKSGKKYYIRIRAYKTVGKKTVYGAYSSVKTVKIK